MSRLIKKILPRAPKKKPSPTNQDGRDKSQGQNHYSPEDLKIMPISASLQANDEILRSVLGQNSYVIFRSFRLGLLGNPGAMIIYVDGMIEKKLISSEIMKPLMFETRIADFESIKGNPLAFIRNFGITSASIREIRTMNDVVSEILYGNAALIIDGIDTGISIDVKGWETRGMSEPESEVLVRGPREGFTETLLNNTVLIRRRLRTPDLVFMEINVGKLSNTAVSIAYVRGVADPSLVAEVVSRLNRINIDGIMESGYIEELIEDNPYSPFPQVAHTERPDRVAAALLAGRVAILTDGTPVALVVPAEFVSFMQSPDDYYERFYFGTAVRWLRYIAFAMSLLLPSLYIAITTFHQEMIPTRLLISLAAAREGVPFPALVEAMLMEFTFEALREAGIRLPRAVGQAVSIVGALVIGQAAVQAGIVSPLMVIVVAVTGIASFMNPTYSTGITMRLLRFPMMILAGTLGLFGVMTGILAILIHMAGLRSFGVPYLASLAPLHTSDLKDVLVRAPWWSMNRRPAETSKTNRIRQGKGTKPTPPEPGNSKGGESS